MTQTRQLAAIMFTDIVGYTVLMGNNAGKALKLIQVNREIQKPLVEEHNGQWLKEMGDGALIKFSSALDAVQCAIAIQAEARAKLDGKLRIGIHLGDIAVEQNDVFGDGVNIASRLERIADPGGIYISDAVLKSIRGQTDLKVEDLGEITLKNVNYPIRTYALQGLGLPQPGLSPNGKKGRDIRSRGRMIMLLLILLGLIIAGSFAFTNWMVRNEKSNHLLADPVVEKSIAVLPFADMSPTQDQEYLSDGLAEEIINVLTQVSGLKVIGRTSSFSFKGQNVDLREIGNKLGVRYILEGSVRKSNDQIRVTAQLINSADGSHLWSTNFNNELKDIFAIQDAIAQNLAQKFELTLDLSKSADPPTRNIAAYELFLKGRESHKIGLAGSGEAKQYLEEALVLDPNFSEAAALLSFVYWQHILYELGDRDIFESKAKEMAQRAIQADPESYHGYANMGWLHTSLDFKWDEARDNYDKAIENGMSLPYPLHSMFKSITMGASMDAIEDIKQLLINDPLSVDLLTHLSRYLLFARRFREVIENGEMALQLNPNNTSVKRHMATSFLLLGDVEQAEAAFKELYTYNPRYSPHGYIGALMASGKKTEALEVLNETKYQIHPAKVALSYMYLESLDSTFHYLNRAFEERDFYLSLIRLDPHYDRIKDDVRYRDLIKQMNFPSNLAD